MQSKRSTGRRTKTEQERVQDILQKSGPLALRIMVEAMQDEELKPELRIQCCKEILARAYGKGTHDEEVQEAIKVELSQEISELAK